MSNLSPVSLVGILALLFCLVVAAIAVLSNIFA
jgi:hypothetical protein